MTTFAAIPFEEQLSWGFLLCELIHVQHPQQDMTTWHKKCGDDTSRPGSKICICIYVRYTTLWRTAVSLLHLALVQLLFGTRAIQARTQRSAEAFFVHGCQDLNHPSSIIIHHPPSSSIYIRARPTAKCSNHLRFTWLSGLLQHEEFMHLQLRHVLAAIMISISVVSPVIFFSTAFIEDQRDGMGDV